MIVPTSTTPETAIPMVFQGRSTVGFGFGFGVISSVGFATSSGFSSSTASRPNLNFLWGICAAEESSESSGFLAPRIVRPRSAERLVGSRRRADSRQYLRSRGDSTTALIQTQYSTFDESARSKRASNSRASERFPARAAAIASVSVVLVESATCCSSIFPRKSSIAFFFAQRYPTLV